MEDKDLITPCEYMKQDLKGMYLCDQKLCPHECAHMSYGNGLICKKELYRKIVIEGKDELRLRNPRYGKIKKFAESLESKL